MNSEITPHAEPAVSFERCWSSERAGGINLGPTEEVTLELTTFAYNDSEDLWEPFGGELRDEARKLIERFRHSLQGF